jgi:hypothetical protein
MLVNIHGTILSLLQFEHLNSFDNTNLEGVLFGKITCTNQSVVNDAIDSTENLVIVTITSFKRIDRYYNMDGSIDIDKLSSINGNMNVLFWLKIGYCWIVQVPKRCSSLYGSKGESCF